MANRLLTIAIAAFAAANGFKAAAATFYVDATITSACTTYSPASRACAGGTNWAFRSIREAAAAASAGDTVVVRSGTYSEPLAPSRSGTAAASILFKVPPGEVVHLKATPAIQLAGRSHIVIDGFTVENTTWLEARDAHSNTLRNCTFRRTPATGTTGNARFTQSHYNLIISNVFDVGQDNLLLIDANYNRVIGNTFREGRHSLLSIRCADFNVIRGNYFSNSIQKVIEVFDCGAGTSAVPNSFNSTRRNLIEDNIFADASSYYSASGGNGIQYSGQLGIIRRNIFYECNVGIGSGTYADEALFNTTNRVYHNVMYANDLAGIAISGSTTNNIYKNNILAANRGGLPDGAAVSPGQLMFRRPMGTGLQLVNNNTFYQQPGQLVFEEAFGSGFTLLAFNNLFPTINVGALEVDPRFVNPAQRDFRLATNSPMIDAGAFLSRTTSAGSGNTLPVADVFYFYDGWGIAGEAPDLIQLAGQSITARVQRIDYQNSTLVLDRSLTWTNNQGVSLPFHGRGPDTGAYEYHPSSSRPTPPDNLRVR
jgi:hypothetical protein